MSPEPERPLRLREAAMRIGVSETTVERLVRKGHLERADLPGVRRVRVSAASVRRYLGQAPAAQTASRYDAWYAERQARRAAGRPRTARTQTEARAV